MAYDIRITNLLKMLFPFCYFSFFVLGIKEFILLLIFLIAEIIFITIKISFNLSISLLYDYFLLSLIFNWHGFLEYHNRY